MDFEITTKGKNLFLRIATVTLLLMMVITTLLWWFVSPRLHEINKLLAEISLTALRIFYIVLILGSILVYLTCFLERNFLVARFAVVAFNRVLFPVTIVFGRIIGISKDKLRESYVHVNNALMKTINKKFKAKEIFILLPHCLQSTECDLRITVDINNCAGCGKCNISELIKLAKRYNVKIAIATGGTLARRIIINHKPKFIIAVACQRDLVDGLQDVFPIPVYGVLNERPEGPCINTIVDITKIETALKNIISDKK